MLQSLSPAAGEGRSRTVDFREAEASMYIRTIDSNPTTIIYLPLFRELDGKARLPLQLLESPSAVRRTGTALVSVVVSKSNLHVFNISHRWMCYEV